MRLPRVLVGCAVLVAMSLPALTPGTGEEASAAVSSESLLDEPVLDEPVTIEGATTETETVVANPDGTYTTTISAEPERVRDEDGWRDIDTNLAPVGDVVVPEAAPGDVELSAGGDDSALFSIDIEGVRSSVWWPDTLPEPVLTDNTATYEGVFDGVDLRVSVSAVGISQVLVVHDAEAAANPALRELTFPLEVRNGELKADSAGVLTLVDEYGTEVGASSGAKMWDSSGSSVAPGDGAQAMALAGVDVGTEASGPSDGDTLTTIETVLEDDALTLLPPEEALSGAEVAYPLYIDPPLTAERNGRAMVYKEHPKSSFFNWTDSNGQGVGFQNADGVSTKRLYWNFNTPNIGSAEVVSASFDAKLLFSWSCTPRAVQVYRTAKVDSRTTWNNKPAFDSDRHQDSRTVAGGRSGCAEQERIGFDVSKAMKSVANTNAPTVTFGMKVPASLEDGTDPSGWKRFGAKARLTVVTRTRPNTPSNLEMAEPSGKCGALFGADAPKLAARISDPDATKLLRAEFKLTGTTSAGTPKTWSYTSSPVKSGSRVVTSTSGVGTNSTGDPVSGTYSWRVRAYDAQGVSSAWTTSCSFRIDADRPRAPRIILPDIEWKFGGPAGQVQFAPHPSDSDVFQYYWGLDTDAPSKGVGANATTMIGTANVAPSRIGLNKISAKAVDRAMNQSPVASATFEAHGLLEKERYSFNDIGQLSSYNLVTEPGQPPGSNGGLLHAQEIQKSIGGRYEEYAPDPMPPGWEPGWIEEYALAPYGRFDAGNPFAGPRFDTKNSYMVSFFVKPKDFSGTSTLVRQQGVDKNGTMRSAFELAVEASCPRTTVAADGAETDIVGASCFSFRVWDDAVGAYATAYSDLPATDEWFHVVGAYHAGSQDVFLWLGKGKGVVCKNRLETELMCRSPWSARITTPIASTEGLYIGRYRNGAGPADRPTVALIDNVVVSQGVPDRASLVRYDSEEFGLLPRLTPEPY